MDTINGSQRFILSGKLTPKYQTAKRHDEMGRECLQLSATRLTSSHGRLAVDRMIVISVYLGMGTLLFRFFRLFRDYF